MGPLQVAELTCVVRVQDHVVPQTSFMVLCVPTSISLSVTSADSIVEGFENQFTQIHLLMGRVSKDVRPGFKNFQNYHCLFCCF